MGRPLLRAAWTQNAEPWEKAPGLRVSFLRKRLAKDFWSRLILLFSPEADVPAGNSSQLLQLAILGSPSQFFCLALRSFPRSASLFLCSGQPQSVFLAWRSGHSPRSVFLFPCSGQPQSSFLSLRSAHSPRSASLFLCSGQPQSSFLSWHSGHSPRSVFLFPCSGPSQVVLAGRLFCIFWGLALTIGHKRDNFSPVPRN